MKYTEKQLQNIFDLLVIKVEKAGGRIVEKTGVFWTIVHWLVFIITFGSNRTFKSGYYTTFGPIIGVPLGWERHSLISRIAVLEHELQHVEQCAWFGFGNVWLGFPAFGLLYLLCPLPVGLAYFRWRFEREAYAHGINVELQLRAPSSVDPGVLREHMIDSAIAQLTTGAYLWTWPFKKNARRYFEEAVLTRYDLEAVARPIGGWGE